MKKSEELIALGQYLRACRERLPPLESARPTRSRTSGLRREDVANRAKISTSWYSALEQGRDVHISSDALSRICDALQLTPKQKKRIFSFAKASGIKPDQTPDRIGRALQRFLDRLMPTPAYIVNQDWKRIGWNHAAIRLLGYNRNNIQRERHLGGAAWQFFVAPNICRESMPLFEHRVDIRQFASSEFQDRAALGSIAIRALIATGPEFKGIWAKGGTLLFSLRNVSLYHPTIGHLELAYFSIKIRQEYGHAICMFCGVPKSAEET